MPEWQFRCWSDMDVRGATKLQHEWPKWWGKFEIYAADFNGPALVIDLDTVFLEELKIQPAHEDKAIFLRDFWRDGSRNPERLAGGFTYLPQWARSHLWRAFCEQKIKPEGDDQPFLHSVFGETALRWQDHYLDEVVSYKSHVRGIGIQPDNKAVCFHGMPRPWGVDEPWIPKLSLTARQPSQELV